uniref:Nucleotide-binding alpha-beta plait domain-containing protein n=1 Tax=Tanacetum cinerariifolium TaxID=118510 RepID=A0A6L2JMD9_TANCI|nr:nucleotide-binding alpha-beta plait domain-containing protein [Tanacetum cinerariifolium]
MNNNGLLLKPNTLFQTPPLMHLTKTHTSFFSPKHSFKPLSSFHLKFPVFASTRAETVTTPKTDEFAFEEDSEFEEFEEEEEEDEDEDIIVPLRNMRQWTHNKPRGFGEGKVYDTSMEDKLLEELEQSRAAQNANVENLKKNPQVGNPKEKVSKLKVSEVAPNGTRVRLVHLPKKKNIHRDLQAAFKPFTGITNIIPAVLGNEKTRELVCKGFAFVDFKSEKEATRFVNTFSTQPMTFGKVQKQIKCEIIKPSSVIPAVKPSVHRTKTALPVTDPSVLVISTPVTETALDSYEEDAALDRSQNDDDDDYNDDNIAKLDNVVQEKQELEAGSEPVKKPKKVKEKGKKTTTGKKKVESTPKLNIPGSANRLKMKEKDMLSGVFSKYSGKSAMAGKGTEVIAD